MSLEGKLESPEHGCDVAEPPNGDLTVRVEEDHTCGLDRTITITLTLNDFAVTPNLLQKVSFLNAFQYRHYTAKHLKFVATRSGSQSPLPSFFSHIVIILLCANKSWCAGKKTGEWRLGMRLAYSTVVSV